MIRILVDTPDEFRAVHAAMDSSEFLAFPYQLNYAVIPPEESIHGAGERTMSSVDNWCMQVVHRLAESALSDSESFQVQQMLARFLNDNRIRIMLNDQLEREREVISAMHYRFTHHHPLRNFLWRKPWRSTATTGWSDGTTLRVKLANFFGWLRNAHDCNDTSIGCSCYPSFRFPAITEKE